MSKENINKQIEKILKNPKITKLIKNFNLQTNNQVTKTCDLVGEIMTYCFVHSSNDDIKIDDVVTYLTCVASSKPENYEQTRIQALKESIGKELKLSEINSPQSRTQMKNYFLQNYVTDGFVTHSFSGACKDSIVKNGFSGSVRLWDSDEILKVAKTFENHGVLFPVGGYSHYAGGGMYVEHNPKQTYWHALSSPEWFKWFTSSNHNKSGDNIQESPYYLKDKNACKQNVIDLCTNSQLSPEETQQVMTLFEKTWQTLGTKQMCTALIPRSQIGKNKIEETVPEGSELEVAMMFALNDYNEQFSEHKGNCLTETLYADQMLIMDLPNAEKFLSKQKYKRESKEELLDPSKIFAIIQRGLKHGTGFELNKNQVSALIERFTKEYGNDPNIMRYIEVNHQKLLQSNRYNVENEKSTKIVQVSQDEIDEAIENNPDIFNNSNEIDIQKTTKSKNNPQNLEKQ